MDYINYQKNKRIGVITIYSGRGQKHVSNSALAGYTKNLLTSLSDNQRSNIVIFSDIKEKKMNFIEDRLEINECWSRGNFLYWYQIVKEIKKYKSIKIIHLQHEFNLFGGITTIPLSFLLLGILKFFLKKKIIITFHGVISQKKITKDFIESNNLKGSPYLMKMVFKLYYRLTMFFLDTVIVHEKYFSDILKKEYKYKKNIIVIPHGVENFKQTLTKEKARELLGIDKRKKVILYFGFLAGYKGIDLLIKGFSLLCDSYLLILAGGKPSRVQNDVSYNKWYQQFKQASELAKNVLTTGFVKEEDIEKYFMACDVVIFPYKVAMSSSGPMSFAIGYEKPFLASDVFSKVISNKKMLFERTPKKLADKIKKFFEDKEEFLDEIKRMKKERLWNNVGKMTQEVYHENLT